MLRRRPAGFSVLTQVHCSLDVVLGHLAFESVIEDSPLIPLPGPELHGRAAHRARKLAMNVLPKVRAIQPDSLLFERNHVVGRPLDELNPHIPPAIHV